MPNPYPVRFFPICLALLLVVFSCPLQAAEASEEPKYPPSLVGEIIFDSDRDLAADGVPSLYLWEGGRMQKFFKGAANPELADDGERIACLLWASPSGGGAEASVGIGILNHRAEVLKEIKPRHRPSDLIWHPFYPNVLFYVGEWQKSALEQPRQVLSYLDINTFEENRIYVTEPGGHIANPGWNASKEQFVLELLDDLDRQGMEPYAVLLALSNGEVTKIYRKAYAPVQLPDGSAFALTTAYAPDGKPIEKNARKFLVTYNIESGEHKVIRAADRIRGMKLTRGRTFVVTSEPFEGRGSAVHIYDAQNLKRAVYVIPPAIDPHGRASQDLNPDWMT